MDADSEDKAIQEFKQVTNGCDDMCIGEITEFVKYMDSPKRSEIYKEMLFTQSTNTLFHRMSLSMMDKFKELKGDTNHEEVD